MKLKEWLRAWKLTKLSKVLVIVLAVVVVASGGAYYYLQKVSPNSTKGQKNEAAIDLPLYYAIQDEKATIYVYDIAAKKNKELFRIDAKQDDTFRFGADYSSKHNKLVYSDITGIWTYDFTTKEQNQLISNKKRSANSESDDAEFYFAPKYSRNGDYIIFMTGYNEGPGGHVNFMKPDGKDVTKIENLHAFTGSFRWANDGRYVAMPGMMDGAYISVATSNDMSKNTTHDLNKSFPFISSFDLDIENNKIIVASSNGGDKNVKNAIYSLDFDGSNIKKISDIDSDSVQVVYDAYVKEAILSQTNWQEKKGLGLFKIVDGKVVDYFKDGEKNIQAVSASKNYIAASANAFSNTSFNLSSLFLIQKDNKSTIAVGEAGEIKFINWIKSSRLPKDLKEVAVVAPTEKEKKLYADSQLTHGHIYDSYYDYCWDYDCSSQTFPYPKMTVSKKPQVVNFSTLPLAKLTGKVEIPVVYLHQDNPFTDEQITIIQDDPSARESFKSVESWLNKQASGRKNSTSISFVNKGKVKIEDNCLRYSGTSKTFETTCVRNQITNSIKELENAPLIITVQMNINAYTSSRVQRVGEKNLLYMIPYNVMSNMEWINSNNYYTEAQKTEQIKKIFTESNYIGWNSSMDLFLTMFGAKSKNATYKQPQSSSSLGCYIDDESDIMCNSSFNNTTVGYGKSFSEKSFGSVTKKELGWYDADGDGADEVDDRCPFDKENNC